tara:strand:+ start:192 stop:362 length:171 start_codon:yes stop_codon:yes gene_type:complete
MAQSLKDIMQYDEIYRLPIIVTQRDLEVEKEYLEFYNKEYWKKYDKAKIKKYEFKR